MSQVKTSRSKSYSELLLRSLQDPQEAALYLEAALEEKDPDPELLSKLMSLALSQVVEARAQTGDLSEAAQHHYEKLSQLLTESGGAEIYTLVALLEALGFQLSVTVAAHESSKE